MLPAQEAQIRSPLAGPAIGETVVLLKQADRPLAYTVGDDLQPRQITPGQLIAAVQCEPDEPALPLPADTNERVQAAYRAAMQAAALRIGRARRPGGATKLRRYLARQLKAARAAAASDPEEIRRIDVLQQIFLDHLPSGVLSDLNEVLRMELAGPALVRRLEGIRARHRLNPPDAALAAGAPDEIMRIVCSDGLL